MSLPDRAPVPRDLLKAVADFTLQACIPIYWHDRNVAFPKHVEGASCFILRFGGGLVGVTAAHVYRAYQAAQSTVPNFVCQMRLRPFALHEAIIDCDDALDIGTFRLTESELEDVGIAIDCRGQWPPPALQKLQLTSSAGFPENMRIISADRSAVFQAHGALSAIEDFNDREILFTYDPQREESFGALPLPPLGLNLSGCSGGPVLMHGLNNGLHRWYPIGLISRGPKRDSGPAVDHGDIAAFEIHRAQRIHVIRPDGTIARPDAGGWLPR